MSLVAFATFFLFALPRLRLAEPQHRPQVPAHLLVADLTALLRDLANLSDPNVLLRTIDAQANSVLSDTNHATRPCVLSKIPGNDEPRLPISLDSS